MSLHDDFGMYYNGTYIGYRQNDGKVVPFLVESVSNDSDLFDLSSYPRDQRVAAEHGEEAYNAMVFHGIVVSSRGSHTNRSVAISDDRLVFDLPDSKYIKVGDQYFWVSYRGNRSTKKGICSRRISAPIQFGERMVMAMYDETVDERIINGIFLKNPTSLDYKGVQVGDLNDNQVSLYAEAAHLTRLLQQGWPECQITVATTGSVTSANG